MAFYPLDRLHEVHADLTGQYCAPQTYRSAAPVFSPMLFASLHEGLRTWVESRNVWGIASFGIQRIWECELKCKKDVLIDDKCASIFWLQENGDNGSLMSLPWQSEYRTSQ
jgi:hypothetical protein